MTFEIRPSKMTSFGRLSVWPKSWLTPCPGDSDLYLELICLFECAKSVGVKQTPAASKIPTFPAADFWYLEFYDLRNKIFIFHHLLRFNIQLNTWSFFAQCQLQCTWTKLCLDTSIFFLMRCLFESPRRFVKWFICSNSSIHFANNDFNIFSY